MCDELVEITGCKHECPFFQSTMDGMSCGHMYWKDKPTYSNMIITHDGKIPIQCPLRIKPFSVKFKLVGE
jgi:hypothetical protein